MIHLTDNVNIRDLQPLPSPEAMKAVCPLPEELAEQVVLQGRHSIQRILSRQDERPLIIVGPCSIHDQEGTLEYAHRLKALQEELGDQVFLVMRTYFEKPRTTIGWKGLLYDPFLDESDNISEGFRLARNILLEITRIGLPTATEFLDPIVPQYLADLVAWASIGARTAASQIHRQMASGLSMPIGFKHSTDGNMTTALEAIRAASNPHAFLGITGEGQVAIANTKGNRYGHLVLRGGSNGPNYHSEYVAYAAELLRKNQVINGLVIDCSHANSGKDHRKQRVAFLDTLRQKREGTAVIRGLMLESYLEPGKQKIQLPPATLEYGISITDGCIGWDETEALIREATRG